MAFDQTSIPKDLRPLNIVRNVVEEPRIAAVGPAQVREIGSPESVPMYYPAGAMPVPDAGFVGVGYVNAAVPGIAAWGPRVAVPVTYQNVNPAFGTGYNPSFVTRVPGGGGITGDVVGSSVSSTASRGSSNLGTTVSGPGVDVVGHDAVARMGFTPILSSKVSGNTTEEKSSESVAGFGCSRSFGNRGGNSSADQESDEGGDDSVSGKKVKLLCSFGGKILPRPSDRVLRYVGGHKRIISVRRDVSFNELVQKMMDTYGQPVYIKYQLPGEDLDALVSVSCRDDLENMMDEYEKLNERSSDGSAKLRLFLFSPSELDVSGMAQFGDIHDINGQQYVDAVNGIVDVVGGSGGGITRKESMTSATSTHSDIGGSEAIESSLPNQGDISGAFLHKQNSGNSDDISPRIDYAEASAVPMRIPILKSGPPRTSSPRMEAELERSLPMGVMTQQFGIQSPVMEIPNRTYVQSYVDPCKEITSQVDYQQPLPPQMTFPGPQYLGTASTVYPQHQVHGNATGLVTRQFIPAVTMSPSHIGFRPNVQPVLQPQTTQLDSFEDGRAYGPRVVQIPVEQNYTPYQVQVPSAVVGGNYSWHQVPMQEHVVYSDGLIPHQPITFSDTMPKPDCYMCQKALPHAHSDTVMQRDSGASLLLDSNSSYNSLHLNGHSRSQPITRVMVGGSTGESALDHGVEGQRRVLPRMDPQIGIVQPEACGYNQNPEVKIEIERINTQLADNIEHPPRVSAPQAAIGRATEIQPLNTTLLGTIPQTSRTDLVQQHPGVGQYLVRPDSLNKAVNRDILPVVGIPVQTSERLIQESPTEYSNIFPGIPPSEDMVEACVSYDQTRPIESRLEPLWMRPTETSINKEHCESPVERLRLEGGLGMPTAVLPSPVEPRLVPTSRLVEAYEVAQPPLWGNPELYAQRKVEAVPLDSKEVHVGNLAFPALDMSVSSTFSPPGKAGDVPDSSNSLFSNQDPWNLRQDSQFLPPRPIKSPSKNEPGIPEDPFVENCVGNGAELNIVEDEVQQSLSNLSTKDLDSEKSQSAKGTGSAEEQIRSDLQAVAEGVAASVFQSNPKSRDRNELATESVKAEDAITKIPEKVHMGFPLSGGIGRLQIIMNVDLEELRELGSGTFGTVYHGKWRGTDVAIKRINDRCFAGKPSEQERMRYDFWNEAIKLADLHHPNVLAFYGVVLDGPGGSVATVTEYMVNGSLRNALQKNEKSLDKRKRLLIAMDVAFGMEYLHGKNIVHFDLKSDNLLVNLRDPHRPICKVGDLGLSKVKCQTLISGGVRGTLPWMAPELLNGSSSLVSEKVDVFSFGIVMWELITGEEPYADLHYGAIIGGIVSNTLRPPIPESCDPEWMSLMERCWSSEPSERPSFKEIANQLRSIAAKLPPKHYPTTANPTTVP